MVARTPWSAPLSPPAPFPSGFMFQNGGNLSRVRKPRRNGAPLTACHRSEDTAEMRERGPLARRAVSRVARGTARYARMRRCLILRQGASPLRPPHFPHIFIPYIRQLHAGGDARATGMRESSSK
jgi:hypothetical protein